MFSFSLFGASLLRECVCSCFHGIWLDFSMEKNLVTSITKLLHSWWVKNAVWGNFNKKWIEGWNYQMLVYVTDSHTKLRMLRENFWSSEHWLGTTALVSMCVWEWEREWECVWMCVCEREREREREAIHISYMTSRDRLVWLLHSFLHSLSLSHTHTQSLSLFLFFSLSLIYETHILLGWVHCSTRQKFCWFEREGQLAAW